MRDVFNAQSLQLFRIKIIENVFALKTGDFSGEIHILAWNSKCVLILLRLPRNVSNQLFEHLKNHDIRFNWIVLEILRNWKLPLSSCSTEFNENTFVTIETKVILRYTELMLDTILFMLIDLRLSKPFRLFYTVINIAMYSCASYNECWRIERK